MQQTLLGDKKPSVPEQAAKPQPKKQDNIITHVEPAPTFKAGLNITGKAATLTIAVDLTAPLTDEERDALVNEAGHWGRYYLLAAHVALRSKTNMEQQEGTHWLKEHITASSNR